MGIRAEPGALVHAYHGTHVFERRDDTVDIFELRADAEPAPRIDRREVVWAGFLTPREALERASLPHMVDYLKDR